MTRTEHALLTRKAMQRVYSDPEFRARHGFLQAREREAIVADAKSGRPYIEIALDWLISEARVSQIARAAGIRRQTSKGNVTGAA